jgi:hypothetical protein
MIHCYLSSGMTRHAGNGLFCVDPVRMRRIALIAYVAFFTVVATTSCVKYDGRQTLEDVKHEQVIVLKKTGPGSVYSIAVRGRGNIAGRTRISLIEGGVSRETQEIHSAVDFKWSGDWYSDTAEIKYEPIEVKGGELIIEYLFATLE